MTAEKIWFDEGRIYLTITDGRTVSLPIKAFPRLYNATDRQREAYLLTSEGIRWEEIDEDLSYEGFFYEDEKTGNEIARLFDTLPEINVNQFARVMNVNQSLMAKYICGISTPSDARKREIEAALHRLGDELKAVTL